MPTPSTPPLATAGANPLTPQVELEGESTSPSPAVEAEATSEPDWSSALSPGLVRVLTFSLGLIATCAVVVTLQYAAPVLVPMVVAVLLFYALDPVVDWLERRHAPRVLSSLVVVTALLGGVVAGAYLLWPQVDAVVAKVPDGARQLREILARQRLEQRSSTLEKVQEAAAAIDTAAAEAGSTTPSPTTPGVVKVEVQQSWRPSDLLWSSSLGAISLGGQALTVLFLTLFLLNEDDSFKRKLVRRMESMGSKRITVQILNDIAAQIEIFLWVQVLTSAVVAVATGLALWWLGVEQAAVWGLLAGILNIVPYFGPLIVTSILAAVGFLQFGTLEMTAVVAGVSLVITTLEGMILTPHMLSRAASLNHVMIFVALAFFSWIWGVAGMLLAVPMLMVMKAIADHVEGLQGVADFLGE